MSIIKLVFTCQNSTIILAELQTFLPHPVIWCPTQVEPNNIWGQTAVGGSQLQVTGSSPFINMSCPIDYDNDTVFLYDIGQHHVSGVG